MTKRFLTILFRMIPDEYFICIIDHISFNIDRKRNGSKEFYGKIILLNTL